MAADRLALGLDH
jgi:hypothetical protein